MDWDIYFFIYPKDPRLEVYVSVCVCVCDRSLYTHKSTAMQLLWKLADDHA